MSVDQIMQPYFDKKKEIDDYIKLKERKETFESRLKDLRENKYLKIQETLNSEFFNKENYLGYESVRKDMEKEYLGEEQVLEQQIISVEKELKNNIYNDDNKKQIVKIKEETRKQLKSLQISLQSRLTEIKTTSQTLILRLSNFKYIYDENHMVQNAEEYKRMFDQVRKLINEKKNIENQLKQIIKYLPLTELSNKDLEIMMVNAKQLEKKEDLTNTSKDNFTEDELIRQSVSNLLEEVYNDIISYANKLRQVQVQDPTEEEKRVIQLPTGMYLNESDLNKAVDKYYKKNKGGTFKIEGIKNEITITQDSIKKLKKSLKKCSAVKLVRDKKIGSYDLTRVYARENVDEIEFIAKNPVEIMTDRKVYTGDPQGWYINGEEFIQHLPLLFEAKKQNWMKKNLESKESVKAK